jgi:hypothetical protein
MKSTPKMSKFSSESVHRCDEKSRSYCAKPTQSDRGTILELDREMRADHATVPT